MNCRHFSNASRLFSNRQNRIIAKQRTEFFKPIQEKAIKAVNDVAAENGFTYIFDTAGGVHWFIHLRFTGYFTPG